MLDAINRAALRRHWLIVLIVSSATHLAHQATSALAKLGGARNTLQRIPITVARIALAAIPQASSLCLLALTWTAARCRRSSVACSALLGLAIWRALVARVAVPRASSLSLLALRWKAVWRNR